MLLLSCHPVPRPPSRVPCPSHECTSPVFGHPPSRCSAQATPHRGNALIAAPWPSPDAPVDEAAAAQFGALQAAARAVRNARAEYGVEPGRKIAATFR